MLRPPPGGVPLQPTMPRHKKSKSSGSGSDSRRSASDENSSVTAGRLAAETPKVATRFSDIIDDLAATESVAKNGTPQDGGKSSKSAFRKLFGRSKTPKASSESSNQLSDQFADDVTKRLCPSPTGGEVSRPAIREVGRPKVDPGTVPTTPTRPGAAASTPKTVKFREFDRPGSFKSPIHVPSPRPRSPSPSGLTLGEFLAADKAAAERVHNTHSIDRAQDQTSRESAAGILEARSKTPRTPSRQSGRYSLFPSASSPSLRLSQAASSLPPGPHTPSLKTDSFSSTPRTPSLETSRYRGRPVRFPPPIPEGEVADNVNITDIPYDVILESFPEPPPASPRSLKVRDSQVFDTASHSESDYIRPLFSPPMPNRPAPLPESFWLRNAKRGSSFGRGEQKQSTGSTEYDGSSTRDNDKREEAEMQIQDRSTAKGKQRVPTDEEQRSSREAEKLVTVATRKEHAETNKAQNLPHTEVRDFASQIHNNRGLSVIMDGIDTVVAKENTHSPSIAQEEPNKSAAPKSEAKLSPHEQIRSATVPEEESKHNKVIAKEDEHSTISKKVRKMASIASLVSRDRSRSEVATPGLSPVAESSSTSPVITDPASFAINEELLKDFEEIDEWLAREQAAVSRNAAERAAVLYPTQAQADEEAHVLARQSFNLMVTRGKTLLHKHSKDQWITDQPWHLLNDEDAYALRLAMKANADRTGMLKKFIVSKFGNKKSREGLRRDFAARDEMAANASKSSPSFDSAHQLRATASSDVIGLGIGSVNTVQPRSKSTSAEWVPEERPTRNVSPVSLAPPLQVTFTEPSSSGRARVVRNAAFFEQIQLASQARAMGLDMRIPPVPKIPEKYKTATVGPVSTLPVVQPREVRLEKGAAETGGAGQRASSGPPPSIDAVEPYLERMIAERSVSSLSDGRATPSGSVVEAPLFSSRDPAAVTPQLGPLRPVSLLSWNFDKGTAVADKDSSAEEVVDGSGLEQPQSSLCSNGNGHEERGVVERFGGEDGMETCSSCSRAFCPACIFSCVEARCALKLCVLCTPEGVCPLHESMF